MTETSPLPVYRRVYVADADALAQVVAHFSQCDAIGVDVEMVQRVQRLPGGFQEWAHVLALIQIAGDGLSAVIDPLRVRDLSPLRPLMAGKVRKVFLGGGQDDSLLEREGMPVRTVVDVGEVALAVFGRKEDGMGALARRIFGLSLDKTIRRADWAVRPLNPVLISYAHLDAEITLGIYQWMQEHHPDVTRFHERVELDPQLPQTAPAWLREAFARPSQDVVVVVVEHGLDPANHAEELSSDVARYLKRARAPRSVNRLLRIAGDLELQQLLPLVMPLTESPSSMIRGAAARAIGFLATPEEGVPVLKQLLDDPLADVQKAAQLALGDINTERVPAETATEETASLDEGTLEALKRLKMVLEDG
jgi:3'-5' exonuclease/HEAT repeats